uniref:Putative sodium channel toxin Ts30 n=1 Tax=Tityus serrulatus TaxID=6887 RepID=SCX30_TITSE|nr:RecName: Full=Putative sodium channel toxin Ts30; AltName: Full=Putative NaTx; AltName: Full=Tityustoxin-30; Flags: Precursor [Tityus serrulatus]QPD99024.1 venom toxin Ts30 [Tityus serrulatus]
MFKLAIILALLFFGARAGAVRDGYPILSDGCKYTCKPLGENQNCSRICKEKAGSWYGYCYMWACYCTDVSKKAVLFGDSGTPECHVWIK